MVFYDEGPDFHGRYYGGGYYGYRGKGSKGGFVIQKCAIVCALPPPPCDPSPYCKGYNCCPKPQQPPPQLRCYEDSHFVSGGRGSKGGKGGYYEGVSGGYYGFYSDDDPDFGPADDDAFGGYYGFNGGYYGDKGRKGGKGGKGGGFAYSGSTIVCEHDYNWDSMYWGGYQDNAFGYGLDMSTWGSNNGYFNNNNMGGGSGYITGGEGYNVGSSYYGYNTVRNSGYIGGGGGKITKAPSIPFPTPSPVSSSLQIMAKTTTSASAPYSVVPFSLPSLGDSPDNSVASLKSSEYAFVSSSASTTTKTNYTATIAVMISLVSASVVFVILV